MRLLSSRSSARRPLHCLISCLGRNWPLLYRHMVEAATSTSRAQSPTVDARKVQEFIRSLSTLAKTGRIDAAALARYRRERNADLSRPTTSTATGPTPWYRPAIRCRRPYRIHRQPRRTTFRSA